MSTKFVDFVFDAPPSHDVPGFVEVENDKGCGMKLGQWIDRGDGLWALRLTPAYMDRVFGAPRRAVDIAREAARGK